MKWNTEGDMNEFRRLYPQAHNFLLERSLLNEYNYLAGQYKPCLSEWQLSRLEELEWWYKNRLEV